MLIMGCTHSKAVAAPAPKVTTDDRAPITDGGSNHGMKRSSSNRSFHSRNSHAKQSDASSSIKVPASPERKSKAVVKSMTNGGSIHKKAQSPARIAASSVVSSSKTTTTKSEGSQWKVLWQTLPHPVDPADVPAVISDLMATQINKLSPTEITFLQRRIRFMSKSSQQQKKGGRFRMSTEPVQVEKQHLLDDYVIRRLWGMPSSSSSSELYIRFHVQSDPNNVTVDIVGSAIVLVSHLGEPLWERAALIAVDAADTAGLEMDVNKKSPGEDKIAPLAPALEEYASQTVLSGGISFHSVCFLQALALRKYTLYGCCCV